MGEDTVVGRPPTVNTGSAPAVRRLPMRRIAHVPCLAVALLLLLGGGATGPFYYAECRSDDSQTPVTPAETSAAKNAGLRADFKAPC